MLRTAVLAFLLAGADISVANDSGPNSDEPQTSRVADLDHADSERPTPPGPSPSYLGDVGSLPPAITESPSFSHGVVYDNGWTLRPIDPVRTPYELKISLHDQFRYTGFVSDEQFVVDSAGQTVPTPSRNDFAVNRGRLVFSGYAIDPLLEFYANVDYNTVAEQQIQMLMAWIRHPFHPAFNLAYGLGKVPGTWEWQESARWTLGAERSLATTFFRPSMTAGIWAEGELRPGLHYHALIGNGFNTTSLKSSQLDDNLAYSGMLWWEPWGEFGRGFSDLECHSEAAFRIGQAFTFSRQDSDPTDEPGPEQTVVRLSDGTRLVEPGALAPGVTVNQFDLSLYTIHAGWKRRGFSLSGEYFLRWLNNIGASGPIPEKSIFDHGFFLQSGTFVVPQSVELFARGSVVSGPFGDGSEVGGGVNWYVKNRREWRCTFDLARVDDSPAQQDRTGFLAGASGLLVRTQVWISF
jgi:hypothetical protein